MRSYAIDQLDMADTKKIAACLAGMGLQSSMPGLFWLPVPEGQYTAVQAEHKLECGPFCLGLEVSEGAVTMELLVRAMNKMRCECLAFASPALRDHMIAWLENLLKEQGIEP